MPPKRPTRRSAISAPPITKKIVKVKRITRVSSEREFGDIEQTVSSRTQQLILI